MVAGGSEDVGDHQWGAVAQPCDLLGVGIMPATEVDELAVAAHEPLTHELALRAPEEPPHPDVCRVAEGHELITPTADDARLGWSGHAP